MTKYLKLFTLFSLAWAVCFFAVLNWALYNADKRWPVLLLASVVYGIGFAIMGHQLGKRDSSRHTRSNLSFWYAAVAAGASLVINGLWALWFHAEERRDFALVALIMLVAFGFYRYLSRKTIKGIPRKELFK